MGLHSWRRLILRLDEVDELARAVCSGEEEAEGSGGCDRGDNDDDNDGTNGVAQKTKHLAFCFWVPDL